MPLFPSFTTWRDWRGNTHSPWERSSDNASMIPCCKFSPKLRRLTGGVTQLFTDQIPETGDFQKRASWLKLTAPRFYKLRPSVDATWRWMRRYGNNNGELSNYSEPDWPGASALFHQTDRT
jgi:hypothetical protein